MQICKFANLCANEYDLQFVAIGKTQLCVWHDPFAEKKGSDKWKFVHFWWAFIPQHLLIKYPLTSKFWKYVCGVFFGFLGVYSAVLVLAPDLLWTNNVSSFSDVYVCDHVSVFPFCQFCNVDWGCETVMPSHFLSVISNTSDTICTHA